MTPADTKMALNNQMRKLPVSPQTVHFSAPSAAQGAMSEFNPPKPMECLCEENLSSEKQGFTFHSTGGKGEL